MNRFINWAKANHRRNQIIAAIVIGGSSAIFFLLIGIYFLYKALYLPAIGMFIASTFLFLCVAWTFIDPEKYKINRVAKKIKRDIEKEDNMENETNKHIK